jgi:hypothetical protein
MMAKSMQKIAKHLWRIDALAPFAYAKANFAKGIPDDSAHSPNSGP